MINVLLVDDHSILREGIKRILSETPDITVTGEAASASESIDLMWKNKYDVIVLDIAMPGRSGLDVLKQLKGVQANIQVLILSMYSEKEYALRALKNGAAGYLEKKSAAKELIEAIRIVALGGKYVSRDLASQLATEVGKETSGFPHMSLSNREYEVMYMIATGKTVQQIANELLLSKSTISTHRGRILTKMKMTTNAEIIYYAIKERLVF